MESLQLTKLRKLRYVGNMYEGKRRVGYFFYFLFHESLNKDMPHNDIVAEFRFFDL